MVLGPQKYQSQLQFTDYYTQAEKEIHHELFENSDTKLKQASSDLKKSLQIQSMTIKSRVNYKQTAGDTNEPASP